MQIPRINSIATNTGIGRKAVVDNKHTFTASSATEPIAGQRPVVTRAKKWVDKSQLKKNMPIGCKVTSRHNNTHQSSDRLINRVIPRIEDFSPGGARGSLRDRSWGPLRLSGAKNTVDAVSTAGAATLFKWQRAPHRLADEASATHPSRKAHTTSTSLGIPDTAVTTSSEGQSTQFDQSDTLYGLDITTVFSPLKNHYSSQPKYSLSAFQMPLYQGAGAPASLASPAPPASLAEGGAEGVFYTLVVPSPLQAPLTGRLEAPGCAGGLSGAPAVAARTELGPSTVLRGPPRSRLLFERELIITSHI
jgi:ribosomal protein L5